MLGRSAIIPETSILNLSYANSIRLSAIAWLAGCWLFQQSAALPAWPMLFGIGLLLLISMIFRLPGPVSIGIAAWLWAAGHALWQAPPAIDHLDTRTDYQASGVIVSLPEVRQDRVRFQLRVSQLQSAGHTMQGDWLLRTTWYQTTTPPVKVGQQWRFNLRIKPVQGYRNPGGWDYAAWLYHQGIRYTAYVRSAETARLVRQTSCCWLDRQREYLHDRLRQLNVSETAEGILLALTIGDKSQLAEADKQTFALTGTSHLMAISGLHIGLVAGLLGGLVSLIWRRIPSVCARYPALLAGTVAGLIAGGVYALLSGFGLPAQRALIMLGVAAIALLQRQRCRPLDVLALAAIAVVAYQPGAVLSAGFWLSFGAVGTILLVLPQISRYHWLIQALIVQLGVSLALYPILLLFGMASHLLAPLINLVLIPVFTFLIVPVSLLGVALLAVFDWAGTPLSWLAAGLDRLIPLLSQAAHLDSLHWYGTDKPWWLWLMLISGAFLLLAPVAPVWRLCGILLFGLGHITSKSSVPPGDYQVTLLDVGQGLSAVVQTHQHALLYDTGAAYRSGFNLADAVVLPYLRHQQIQRIDTLVISHGDNDHAGGAAHLLEKLPVERLIAGEPGRLNLPGQRCQGGQTWTWDGVTFTLLHPQSIHPHSNPRKSNNASCVLVVANEVGATLLPGDIEKRIEYQLIPTLAKHAPYRLMIAPHHGSNSSSSAGLIEISRAEHVLYPVGAYNRYRFPHTSVLQRWRDSGARNWRTDQSGAIQFEFSRQQGLVGPNRYRIQHQRYWHRRE